MSRRLTRQVIFSRIQVMNVTELARKLKMNTSELFDLLPKIGFDIGRRAIKIDSNMVEKIISAVEDFKRKQTDCHQQGQIKEIHLSDAKGKTISLGDKVVIIPEVIIVRELADKLNLPVTKVISELMKNGVMSGLNERIDFTTAAIIAEDLGYKAEKADEADIETKQDEEASQKLKGLIQNQEGAITRSPVVVVMGHVDHGKTKLLDVIRHTNVAGGESGGITQAIGAYQAIKKDRLITFLDTPGHEAFRSMRSRGSKVADVAIVVVAADDGLQPQTLEVIEMVQKERLPFIVAINKIDKVGADIDRVKKELSEINLIPEDWGGKTICVPISAKEMKGIDELLDMVLLIADMEAFKADPIRPAIGTIIESHMDKGEGPVATVLIQAGTLRTGDMIIAGNVSGKVKALRNFKNQEVSEATPSMPVKILGLKAIPQVGDILEATDDKKKVMELVKNLKSIGQPSIMSAVKNLSKAEKDKEKESAKQGLNLVLKADALGSLEAISQSLDSFEDVEVELKINKKGLGMVTDVDVFDAAGSNGMVIAFNVKALPSAEQLARDKHIEILHFNIIYRLFEEITARLKAMLTPQVIRTELGRAHVLAIFKTEKKEMIVGGRVMEGKVKTGTKVKVVRNGETITIGDLKELKIGKEKMTEAVAGEECGMQFIGEPVIQINDTLEIYLEEVKEREIKKFKYA